MKSDPKSDRPAEDTAERFYRLLMSLYPVEHRESYEVPMLQLFHDIYRREVKSEGFVAVLRFWLFTLEDILKSAFRERLTEGATHLSTPSAKPNTAAWAGFVLLAVPTYFVAASLLKQHAPGLSFFGSPIILLGTLLFAFALNSLAIVSVELRTTNAASVLNVGLSLRIRNLVVIGAALLLLGALLGYAFIENFQPRAVGTVFVHIV
jgi:hypothetical protein